VSCAKTAESIEMLFGLWTRVGSRKHVLGGLHIGATWWIWLAYVWRWCSLLSNYVDHLFTLHVQNILTSLLWQLLTKH